MKNVHQSDYVLKSGVDPRSMLLSPMAKDAGKDLALYEDWVRSFVEKKEKDPSSEEEVYNSQDDVS
eukprot:SAG22_NODE_4042_length_1411_cov_27.146341_2_plen_66_part_00